MTGQLPTEAGQRATATAPRRCGVGAMPSGLRQVYDMVPTKSRNVRGRRMRARTQCPATCHACGQERGQVSRGVETTRGAAGPPFSWGSAAPSRAIACPPPRARQSILRLTGVCLCLCLRRQRARFTGTRASRARGTRATTPTPRPGRTAHMHASRSRTSRTATRPALWAWLSSALAPPPTAPPVREAPPRPTPRARACGLARVRVPSLAPAGSPRAAVCSARAVYIYI